MLIHKERTAPKPIQCRNGTIQQCLSPSRAGRGRTHPQLPISLPHRRPSLPDHQKIVHNSRVLRRGREFAADAAHPGPNHIVLPHQRIGRILIYATYPSYPSINQTAHSFPRGRTSSAVPSPHAFAATWPSCWDGIPNFHCPIWRRWYALASYAIVSARECSPHWFFWIINWPRGLVVPLACQGFVI